MESNVNSYKLEQNNINYILTTSLQGDTIKISCKSESEPTKVFIRLFTLENLKKLDEIFNIIKTPLEGIEWLDKALKVQKVHVRQEDSSLKLLFIITTKGISHQIEIPMKEEGHISETLDTDLTKGVNIDYTQTIKTTETKTTTITEADFNREIGIDPSLIVRQTLNENTQQLIKSIEDEQKNYLSQLNFQDVNNYNVSAPLTEEKTDINIENIIGQNTFQDSSYQIRENTTAIIPETSIATTDNITQNEEANYDLTQFTNTNEQVNIEQYSENVVENIPDLNAQYTASEQYKTTPEITTQYNFEEYNISSTPEISQQYTETTTQIPFTTEIGRDIQATYSQPYITPADDNYDQVNQIQTTTTEAKVEETPIDYNLGNIEQGYTETNYGEYQTNITNDTQFDTQNFVTSDLINVETQNIQVYGLQNIGEQTFPLETYGVEQTGINIENNQLSEIQILKAKVDELMGLKSQLGELNSLKAQLSHIGSLNNIMEEINKLRVQLNQLAINDQNNETDLLKSKISELELLKLQYEKEIMSLKGSQEISGKTSEIDKRQHVMQEKAQQYTVKGDIIHSEEEIELITRRINKINKKITLNLIYKATVDSDKAGAFHEKCDGAHSSLVLVETDKGKRFGGFTTSSWSGDCIDKKDADAFIFSLDKMMVYDNIPEEPAIGCYPKYGPIFLGCQIRIYDNAFTQGGTTFEKVLNYKTEEDYELTGGDRKFNIKEIEVYEVIVE